MSFVHPFEDDEEDYELIEEGAVSTVSRTWTKINNDESRWVVLKSATTVRKFSKEPHDILKELRILLSISHVNIIQVLDSSNDTTPMSPTLNIWMLYIPISLSQLLASPLFSPHPLSSVDHDEKARTSLECRFDAISRSIMYQTLSALAYLHETQKVAHRDIKPNNILLTSDGCVKLIDFGIAWKDFGDDEEDERLWPESSEKMYFEVSTGPYRAPELLFGTRSYDPFAIDIWSLGATFAESYTPLRLHSDEEEDFRDVLEDSQPLKPFIVPEGLSIGDPETIWIRDTLFNGNRGEIGLAWSIFKIRGTPTKEIWPEFESLPDAKGVTFNIVPPVVLPPLLPNLPPSSILDSSGLSPGHFPDDTMVSSPQDLLSRFLVYPSSRRLKSTQAMLHPWFTAGILLPGDYPLKDNGKERLTEYEGKTLGQWLQLILS